MKRGVMMQFFEWNLPNNGKLWRMLKMEATHLNQIGITAIWIPPAYKATSSDDAGYGIYDLYDLGEFNQKGTIRTKYGTKQELHEAIDELHKYQMSIYLDAVMNHKAAADYTERFIVKEVDPTHRDRIISDAFEIEGETGFNFPGRNNKYSDFKWNWQHFTGVDYDARTKRRGIYMIQGEGKGWSENVDNENGNYDYLMFADVDFKNEEVTTHVKSWGKWVSNELNLDGMRLDALKHIDSNFIKEFLKTLRDERGESFYAVGEYWNRALDSLDGYLSDEDYYVDLFDVPLHYNMVEASEQGENYDLRTILDRTLVKNHPKLAVTFVENHDTQEGSSLQSVVQDWFKPSAYALILLMRDGYPCIFYGDYYGVKEQESIHKLIIDILLRARERFAYGEQCDYFDHPSTIGFVRMGDNEYPKSGCAVLISNGNNGYKKMYVGKEHSEQIWYEFTGNIKDEIIIDKDGYGNFRVEGGNLAIWVAK